MCGVSLRRQAAFNPSIPQLAERDRRAGANVFRLATKQ